MEPVSRDLNINKQSNLKVVCEICELLDYKPKTLAEVLRINDILCEYTLYGLQPSIKADIKRFDQHIKNNQPLPINVGYKQPTE